MRAIFAVAVALALTSSAASAQAGRTAKSKSAAGGYVEGDVYLVMQNGDTKRGSGRTVVLLSDAGGRLMPNIKLACSDYFLRTRDLFAWFRALLDTESMVRGGRPGMPDIYAVLNREQRLAKGIGELRAGARQSILELLVDARVDSAGTGMNAHYRIGVKRPGRYYAFSEWTIGSESHTWFAPLVVTAGETARRDLDNSVLFDPFSCLAPPEAKLP